jgi:hypothetical protein
MELRWGRVKKEKTCKTKAEKRGYVKTYVNKIRWGFVNWICLTQDRDKCQAVMNKVMQLEFP